MDSILQYLNQFKEAFLGLGSYAYIVAGIFVLALVYGIMSYTYQKNAKKNWLSTHEGAVKIALDTGSNVITQKDMRVNVISGEASVFIERAGKYAVYAMPGDVVLEVTYTYTRPGVIHKTVSTTWGPAKLELHVEKNHEYKLVFDRDAENFFLKEL